MTIAKFRTYSVTGNTYAFRDQLKKVGRWDAPSKTWIVETGGMRTYSQAAHVLDRVQAGGCTVEEL